MRRQWRSVPTSPTPHRRVLVKDEIAGWTLIIKTAAVRRTSAVAAASVGQVEPVEPRRGAPKQVGLFAVACALRQKLAGVPEHGIAVRALVDRKVALEHAPLRGESVD